jgi:hypothetical protein
MQKYVKSMKQQGFGFQNSSLQSAPPGQIQAVLLLAYRGRFCDPTVACFQKIEGATISIVTPSSSRGGGIRTRDPLLPKQVR